jgi:hypothetical protein
LRPAEESIAANLEVLVANGSLRCRYFNEFVGTERDAQVLINVLPSRFVCRVTNTGHKAKRFVQVDRRQAGGERIQEGARMAEQA